MKQDEMRAILLTLKMRRQNPNITFMIVRYACIMFPKIYCEMNPIENCRPRSNYPIESLRKNIPYSFDNISIKNIQNHFLRKVRHYMFGFLGGHVTGPELENKIKRYKKRIPVSL